MAAAALRQRANQAGGSVWEGGELSSSGFRVSCREASSDPFLTTTPLQSSDPHSLAQLHSLLDRCEAGHPFRGPLAALSDAAPVQARGLRGLVSDPLTVRPAPCRDPPTATCPPSPVAHTEPQPGSGLPASTPHLLHFPPKWPWGAAGPLRGCFLILQRGLNCWLGRTPGRMEQVGPGRSAHLHGEAHSQPVLRAGQCAPSQHLPRAQV